MLTSMRRLSALTLVLTALISAGCGSRPDRSGELAAVRTLYVTPTISGHLSDASHRLEDTVQSSVARALASRGYAVGPEAGADATLRVAWILGNEISPSGQEERMLSLSLSIFSHSGQRIYSARSVQNWPERMWSEDRVATEITRMLSGLPEARSSLVPAPGKPALAPIRLK